MGALRSLLERVLALPECDAEAAALLRAFLAGDRSEELLERTRDRFRAHVGGTPASRAASRVAVGWSVVAPQADLAHDLARRDAAIGWAERELDFVRREALTGAPALDAGWEADPVAQPGGRA